MPYSAEQIRELLAEGEGPTIELKGVVRDPAPIAVVITAFANSNGGKLIIGVSEAPTGKGIIGVDINRTTSLYNQALHHLSPTPTTDLQFTDIDGKSVAVIEVKPSTVLVLSSFGVFIRAGAAIRPMQTQDIDSALRLTEQDQQTTRQPATTVESNAEPGPTHTIATALNEMTLQIVKLQRELEATNSVRSKAETYIIGGLVGAVISAIISALFALGG